MRVESAAMAGPRAEIVAGVPERLPDDALFAFVFGSGRSTAGDPRILRTGLSTIEGVTATEVWRAPGPTTTAVEGLIRYSANPDFLFGFLDLDEDEFEGVAVAAESAYRSIREFQEQQSQRHLLRIWNLMDSINEGEGDDERYRQFCVGRARGLGDFAAESLPAATAVGRPRRTGRVQVCWMAGRASGRPIENPRQVRAYRYPREHGPSPPAFARAMRLDSGELIGSGTSSIVGHESRHDGDLVAQVDETLSNLRELHRAGGGTGRPAGVKVYLRERAGASDVEKRVRAGLSGPERPLMIEADICRKELLVEIESLWI